MSLLGRRNKCWVVLVFGLFVTVTSVASFVAPSLHNSVMTRSVVVLASVNNDNNNIESSANNDEEFMNDLGWRAARIRLEEENTKSFLKRRPRKLRYEDARKWIQANLGPDTKEEFYDLVANGNLRTPYIPKRPEEYYTETNEWVSWEHFLHGIFDTDSPSGIRPPTGEFD